MEVDGDDVVNASDAQEVGKHASCNGASVRLLLRLATVGEVGENGCLESQTMCSSIVEHARRTSDLVGRAAFAGIDHDQKLHDGVVDLGTPRLNDEDILLAHTGQDPNARLALLFCSLVSLECVMHWAKAREPQEETQNSWQAQASREQAHIGELGQLRLSRRLAQVLTYLAGENWA